VISDNFNPSNVLTHVGIIFCPGFKLYTINGINVIYILYVGIMLLVKPSTKKSDDISIQ